MEKSNRMDYINNYKRKNYKRLICEVRKDYYEDILEPYLLNHIISTSTFIKRCMDYVIENDIDIFQEGK